MTSELVRSAWLGRRDSTCRWLARSFMIENKFSSEDFLADCHQAIFTPNGHSWKDATGTTD